MEKQKKSQIPKKKTKLQTFFTSKNKKNIVKRNTNKPNFPFRKNPLDYFENEFKVKENTSKVSSKHFQSKGSKQSRGSRNIKKEDSINFRYRYHDFCTNYPFCDHS